MCLRLSLLGKRLSSTNPMMERVWKLMPVRETIWWSVQSKKTKKIRPGLQKKKMRQKLENTYNWNGRFSCFMGAADGSRGISRNLRYEVQVVEVQIRVLHEQQNRRNLSTTSSQHEIRDG